MKRINYSVIPSANILESDIIKTSEIFTCVITWRLNLDVSNYFLPPTCIVFALCAENFLNILNLVLFAQNGGIKKSEKV